MDAANLIQQTLESSASKVLNGLINAGILGGPRLVIAAHILSASAGHGDLSGFYNPRWNLPVSSVADNAGSIKTLVRREHTFGSDWIKTTNTGGYFSAGDDPAQVTWFDDEIEVLISTARQLGMPVAVHTGAAEGCKQAIRFGARSIEHAYLIDSEGYRWPNEQDRTSSPQCR